MSNKSRVEDTILEAIKTAYGLALASASTEEQKKGIDNFYHIHLNSLWYQIPTWLDQEREKAVRQTEARVRFEISKQAPEVTNENWEDYDRFINSIWLYWAIENNIKYDRLQDKFVPSELKTGNREEEA